MVSEFLLNFSCTFILVRLLKKLTAISSPRVYFATAVLGDITRSQAPPLQTLAYRATQAKAPLWRRQR
jgi:hypothetical protein